MRAGRRSASFLGLGVLLGALSACGQADFSEEERRLIASLSLSALGELPPDPSNRFSDDPQAAALGEALFFDTGMSANGEVSCGTCHLPERQFQDDLALAQGIGVTNRRTMPLANVAYSSWQFWDGRKDSLWSQALDPIEDPAEHGFDRVAVAHHVASVHKEGYEALFGPLPALDEFPPHASPRGDVTARTAWDSLSEDDRQEVDGFYANVGKALDAFQRTIRHQPTRFDRFADQIAAGERPQGDAAFDSLEIEGLRLFIGKANCIDCHNGPRLTDDHFHNTAVPPVPGLPEDRGRAGAIQELLDDPFNCLGEYSDAGEGDCGELRFMVTESEELERAFKTPSLRGAASRPPYMHAGQIATLEDVLDHYSEAPEPVAGISQISPVIFTDRGRQALIAFLKTLDDE
ncbi:MAG: cytochrome-c peroxidase [Rhizobiaceae bacterium]